MSERDQIKYASCAFPILKGAANFGDWLDNLISELSNKSNSLCHCVDPDRINVLRNDQVDPNDPNVGPTCRVRRGPNHGKHYAFARDGREPVKWFPGTEDQNAYCILLIRRHVEPELLPQFPRRGQIFAYTLLGEIAIACRTTDQGLAKEIIDDFERIKMEPAESFESFAMRFITAYHKVESFAESSSVEIRSRITPFSKVVRVFVSALNNTLIDMGVANTFMFAGNPITSVSSLTKLITLFKSTACQNTCDERRDRLAAQQERDLTTAIPEVTTPTANVIIRPKEHYSQLRGHGSYHKPQQCQPYPNIRPTTLQYQNPQSQQYTPRPYATGGTAMGRGSGGGWYPAQQQSFGVQCHACGGYGHVARQCANTFLQQLQQQQQHRPPVNPNVLLLQQPNPPQQQIPENQALLLQNSDWDDQQSKQYAAEQQLWMEMQLQSETEQDESQQDFWMAQDYTQQKSSMRIAKEGPILTCEGFGTALIPLANNITLIIEGGQYAPECPVNLVADRDLQLCGFFHLARDLQPGTIYRSSPEKGDPAVVQMILRHGLQWFPTAANPNFNYSKQFIAHCATLQNQLIHSVYAQPFSTAKLQTLSACMNALAISLMQDYEQ
ncbi:hypothetical protein DFJ73DRAFT_959708 [Zopfochytrium polystomum]|nr:hypothetical protein DFJ73DRAFT_959708 [Zopfochytrium polystomum]